MQLNHADLPPRKPINMKNDIPQTIDIMSEGFGLAESVMREMIKRNVFLLLDLDDMNMRGKQIVMAFEYCERDISKFCFNVRTRAVDMVDYVNTMVAYRKCVPRGGAPK